MCAESVSESSRGSHRGSHRELLVSTKKGLLVLQYDPTSGETEIVHRAFGGQIAEYACYDSRSGNYFASVTHGQFGPHLYRASDPQGDWTEVEGLSFPEDQEQSVERIWVVEPGVADGQLWAGVAPAALFVSQDDGAHWELVRSLSEHPTRPQWEGGLGGLCLHSICPWPGSPEKLAVGISSVGVWITEDGGDSWRRGVSGLVPGYLPEEAREDTLMHCVHKMIRSDVDPETLYIQFHGGVYRSDDAGESWNDIGISSGLPAEFGFPMVVAPGSADRAYVIPLVADVDRVPPEGKLRVYETRDRGQSWSAHTEGLPQSGSFATILRQAFCHDGHEPFGLAFGTSSGQLFAHLDGHARWHELADGLATVLAVRPGKST